MREIKFRAWNIPTKNMFYWGTLQRINRTDSRNIEAEHNHFMQYTGLKDKNGKEIYEGDIVTSVKFKDGSNYNEVNLHIYYEDAHFGVGMAYLSNVKELKVIGNIYENKDLLKN